MRTPSAPGSVITGLGICGIWAATGVASSTPVKAAIMENGFIGSLPSFDGICNLTVGMAQGLIKEKNFIY